MPFTRTSLTRNSVIYTDTDQPQKKRLISTLADLGYEDAFGQIQQVDFTPQRVQNAQFNGWRVTNSGWHYGLETNGWNWFGGRRGQHFFKFRLSRIGYVQVDKGTTLDLANDWTDLNPAQPTATYNTANLSQQQRTQPLPDGDITVGALVEWRNLWTLPDGDVYVRWRVDGNRLKEDVVIPQAVREWLVANRPPSYYGLQASTSWLSFAFEVDWTDIPKRLRDSVDISSLTDFTDADGEIEARNALDELLFYMPIDYAFVDDADGVRHTVRLRKRFWRAPNGQWYLIVGAKVSDLEGPSGLPAGDLVFDPTINTSVSASTDDADTFFGDRLTHDRFYLARPNGPVTSGIRFSGIAISGNDTVNSVILRAVAYSSSWATLNDTWNFEDADDAATFSVASMPDDRSLIASGGLLEQHNFSKTAGVAYDFPRTTANQEALGALLQNVIDRAGWASGNAIVLLNCHPSDTNLGAGYGHEYASYDHDTYVAPSIIIDFESGITNVDKSASDSGTLSESTVLVKTATVLANDSATLSDSSEIIVELATSESIDLTDSGQLSQLQALSTSDSAGLSEAYAIAIEAVAQDSAALSDIAVLNEIYLASESAALSETVAVEVANDTQDTATLSDTSILAETRLVSVTDSAALTDTATLSSGSDQVANDSAALVETSAIAVEQGSDDNISTTEAVATQATTETSDTASFTDLSQLGGSSQQTANDTAALTESASIETALQGSDTALNTEAQSLNWATDSSDGASLADTTAGAALVTGEDLATLAESALRTGGTQQASTDAFVLAETADIGIEASGSDSSTLSDSGTLARAASVTDTAALTESTTSAVAIAASDGISLTEQSVRTGGTDHIATDSASLNEVSGATIIISGDDSAALIEVASLELASTDAATASETSVQDVSVLAADAALLSEQGSRDAGAEPIGQDNAALSESATLHADFADTDSAGLTEAVSFGQIQTGEDSASLSEVSTLTQTTGAQAAETYALSESVSIEVHLVTEDTAASGETIAPIATLSSADTASSSEASQIISGIYQIGTDGFWLTETSWLDIALHRTDALSAAEAIVERSFAATDLFTAADQAFGVGEGAMPDAITPGSYYHAAILAHWQEVSGQVFEWQDYWWYIVIDNDRITFRQQPFEKDLHHPLWDKYRGPQELIKDEL